ncbi:MAG TPA: hypothetical protein ENJ99_07255, partial [Rhizobiales bacterium]|nr:hypothetical protein [Hyphomicrobiales bacterium]
MAEGAGGADTDSTSNELASRLAMLEKTISERTNAGAGDSGNSKALSQKLAILETRLDELEALKTTLGKLQAAQAGLKTTIAELKQQLASGGGGNNAELASRLAQLEQSLKTISAAAGKDTGNGGPIAGLAAISGRINDLENALNTRLGAMRKELNDQIKARTARLTETVEAASSATSRLDRDITDLRGQTAKLDQRIVELNSGIKQMRESLRVVQ